MNEMSMYPDILQDHHYRGPLSTAFLPNAVSGYKRAAPHADICYLGFCFLS
jgi:hypothetical protein